MSIFRKRSLISLLLCVLLTLGSIISVISYNTIINNDFESFSSEIIGWDDFPVTVETDGTLNYMVSGKQKSIDFNMSKGCSYIASQDLYPLVNLRFDDSNVSYDVSHFVSEVDDTENSLAIFTLVDVVNNSFETVNFQDPIGVTYAGIHNVKQIPASEHVTLQYVTVIKGKIDNAEELWNFDNYKNIMISHWDSYLTGITSFVNYPDSMSENINKYSNSLIENKIQTVSLTCQLLAESILKGNSIDFNAALSIYEEIEAEVVELSDGYKLVLTNGIPDFTRTLNALTEVNAFIFICNNFDNDVYKREEAIELYNQLCDSIQEAIYQTENSLDADFVEASSKGSADNLIFSLDPMSTSATLIDWYIKSSKLGANVEDYSTYVTRSIKSQIETTYSDSYVDKYVYQSVDGIVHLGKTIPYSEISNLNLTISNFQLLDNTSIDISISYEKGKFVISINNAVNYPIAFESIVLTDNILESNYEFDSAKGITTLPAGETELIVTIKDTTISEEMASMNVAREEIGKALSRVGNISTKGCTQVSINEYNQAYQEVENALTDETKTASELSALAEKLNYAIDSLSQVISKYKVCFAQENNTKTFNTADSIFQHITLEHSGKFSEIVLTGKFTDVSAKLYKATDDYYIVGELISESIGEVLHNQAKFSFVDEEGENIQIEKGEYVIEFSTTSSMSVLLADTDVSDIYSFYNDVAIEYSGVALLGSIELTLADRSELQETYNTYSSEDISNYTVESRNVLEKAMNDAFISLCTPCVETNETQNIINKLVLAHDSLEEYASQQQEINSPILLISFISISVILLVGCGITMSQKKKH